ncbi:ABC transporter type 1, transmembrane domain-containing protein, partial [Blastocladiella britannica]
MCSYKKQQHQTDNMLYDAFRQALRSFITLIAIYIVMVISNPWLGLGLVTLMALYWVIQRYYRATNRELKRLEALTRSPVYALFGEVMSGLTTIRAYGSQSRFRAANFAMVDRNSAPYFLQFTAARWLGVRTEFLAAMVTGLTALLGVVARASISQSLLGLTLSYGLQMTVMMNINVFQAAEAESQMNAVERLTYYADQLPQERGSPGDIK